MLDTPCVHPLMYPSTSRLVFSNVDRMNGVDKSIEELVNASLQRHLEVSDFVRRKPVELCVLRQ